MGSLSGEYSRMAEFSRSARCSAISRAGTTFFQVEILTSGLKPPTTSISGLSLRHHRNMSSGRPWTPEAGSNQVHSTPSQISRIGSKWAWRSPSLSCSP